MTCDPDFELTVSGLPVWSGEPGSGWTLLPDGGSEWVNFYDFGQFILTVEEEVYGLAVDGDGSEPCGQLQARVSNGQLKLRCVGSTCDEPLCCEPYHLGGGKFTCRCQ